MLRRITKGAAAAGGLALYYWHILRYRELGYGRIHQRLNRPHIYPLQSRMLREYLDFERYKIGFLQDYVFAQKDHFADRPSDHAIAAYGDDTLAGYGETTYKNGLVPSDLGAQHRGVILPLLERVLSESSGTVCEIGNANGDVIAMLAQKYPERRFVGIDFSTKNAERKWGHLPNVEFHAGYAADILEAFRPGEIETVFTTYTALLFTPPELSRYANVLARLGVRNVVMCEPSWYGWRAAMMDGAQSVHLEKGTFFHNYAGYFGPLGYEVAHLEENPYRHPLSPRPDIVNTLIWLRASR